MTLTLSTWTGAGTTVGPDFTEQIGTSDMTVIYDGETVIPVALPIISSAGSTAITTKVEDGWTCHLSAAGYGGLEIVDAQGRLVKYLRGWQQCALTAYTEGPDCVNGGWMETYNIPNIQVEHTTYTVITKSSDSSQATFPVVKARGVKLQSTFAITDFTGGMIGQELTIVLDGGTNTTECIITNSGSLMLSGARNWNMSTGESLDLIRKSTDQWAEVGRKTNDLGVDEVVLTEATECFPDDYSYFNVSACASAVGASGLIGGKVGQVITFHTSAAFGGLHHSTAVGYMDLANVVSVPTTTDTPTNHGTSYGGGANAFMRLMLDDDGVWHPINDGAWLAS